MGCHPMITEKANFVTNALKDDLSTVNVKRSSNKKRIIYRFFNLCLGCQEHTLCFPHTKSFNFRTCLFTSITSFQTKLLKL